VIFPNGILTETGEGPDEKKALAPEGQRLFAEAEAGLYQA
jgi:hypothetical protein